MALMSKMRDNMHFILFFLLIMFVLSMTIGGLVGGADITSLLSGKRPDTVVSINGEHISYEQYTQLRQQQFETYRQQNQKEPSGYELQNLENQIYESVVRDLLIRQLAQKMNIGVTKSEIAFNIFENPPQFLKTNPNFADSSGNFDINKYHAALSDERNLRYWDVVQNYLVESLPFEKIHQEVISSVFVTDEEVKQDFIKRNQKVKVTYVFFDPNKHTVEDEQIEQKEIKKYYKENEDKYREEEKRKIRYVFFELKPTTSDSNEIKDLAETLLDSIQLGVNFASLAETYSDDPGSAAKGGDLGFFQKGTMVKPFEEASFSADIGEVVGPIFTQHGLHIIKVEDKKTEDGKEMIQARHILLKIEPSRRTSESIRDDASYFAEIAEEEGFSQAIISEKVTIDTTDFFQNSGFIPNLGMQKRMVETIFNTKIGKASKVRYIEDRGNVVYEVIEIQKERIKPLTDVESTIINIIRRDKQKELAGEVCRKFRDNLQNQDDFEMFAEQDSLAINETDFFAMSGYVRGIGRDANIIGTAFGLAMDEVSGAVAGTKGYYLIKLVEKQSFDESTFALQKMSLKFDLLETKKRTAYTNWYNNLKENADIKDFRYKFFY